MVFKIYGIIYFFLIYFWNFFSVILVVMVNLKFENLNLLINKNYILLLNIEVVFFNLLIIEDDNR